MTAVRVLLVGVDAGAPQLFARWTASGDMPNLARLWQGAASGPVENPIALEAGSAWPVFHAGLLPGHQPQYDGRRYFDARDYSTRWYDASQTVPPFWRRLSDQGVRCLVIDPPYVPLEPELHGSMVVDWGAHVPADGRVFRLQTQPAALAQEVLDLVGPDPAGGVSCDRKAPESVAQYREFIACHLERIDKKAKLARHLLARGGWDFALVAFMDLHCAGHHLWHINDHQHPRHRPELERALGEPLRECYRRFDRALGEMLAAVDEHTTVLFLGSHGMGPQYTGSGLLDRILLALDRGAPAPHARSLKGELRALWHRVPVEWRGRLKTLRRPFTGVLHPPEHLGHRAERRFFEVHANNATGGVRINLQGREAQGKVSREEFHPLLERLRDELREIVNADTGEPLADDVFITREHYDGSCLDALPDLLVRWNRRTAIRRVRSPAIGTLIQESADPRTGDHTPGGMFIARGAGIAAGEIAGARMQDFAPTVARLFGRDIGRTDGRTLEGLFAERAARSIA